MDNNPNPKENTQPSTLKGKTKARPQKLTKLRRGLNNRNSSDGHTHVQGTLTSKTLWY
jgi:hypothetical protein